MLALAALLLAACGGDDDHQGPPAASFDIVGGQAVCHSPDRVYTLIQGGSVAECDWDCASHLGEAGSVRAMFRYTGGQFAQVEVVVTPTEGCR
jgi:hypothetical protein